MAAALAGRGPRTIAVLVPQHMLLGFEGVPRPDQKFIQHEGKRYILGEPTGSFPLPLGSTFSVYQRVLAKHVIKPEPSRFNASVVTHAPTARRDKERVSVRVIKQEPT